MSKEIYARLNDGIIYKFVYNKKGTLLYTETLSGDKEPAEPDHYGYSADQLYNDAGTSIVSEDDFDNQ